MITSVDSKKTLSAVYFYSCFCSIVECDAKCYAVARYKENSNLSNAKLHTNNLPNPCSVVAIIYDRKHFKATYDEFDLKFCSIFVFIIFSQCVERTLAWSPRREQLYVLLVSSAELPHLLNNTTWCLKLVDLTLIFEICKQWLKVVMVLNLNKKQTISKHFSKTISLWYVFLIYFAFLLCIKISRLLKGK